MKNLNDWKRNSIALLIIGSMMLSACSLKSDEGTKSKKHRDNRNHGVSISKTTEEVENTNEIDDDDSVSGSETTTTNHSNPANPATTANPGDYYFTQADIEEITGLTLTEGIAYDVSCLRNTTDYMNDYYDCMFFLFEDSDEAVEFYNEVCEEHIPEGEHFDCYTTGEYSYAMDAAFNATFIVRGNLVIMFYNGSIGFEDDLHYHGQDYIDFIIESFS